VRTWLAQVENREIASAWRSWMLFVRTMQNADRLSEMQALLETTTQVKVEKAAYEMTQMIRKQIEQMHVEVHSRDQLVHELRRQLSSQQKVGAHVADLAEQLARSKARCARVQTELNLSRDTFETQVMELRGSTGSRLTSLETQVEREKQKSAVKLEKEKTEWSSKVVRLEQKIKRARELMESKNTTIRGLRQDLKMRNTAVSGLEKEKTAASKKIKELKFRLHELVLDQVNIVKSQREIEDAIRAKQIGEGKTIRLDRLEQLVGRELKMLNEHLDGCVSTVEIIKSQSPSMNLTQSPSNTLHTPPGWKYKGHSKNWKY